MPQLRYWCSRFCCCSRWISTRRPTGGSSGPVLQTYRTSRPASNTATSPVFSSCRAARGRFRRPSSLTARGPVGAAIPETSPSSKRSATRGSPCSCPTSADPVDQAATGGTRAWKGWRPTRSQPCCILAAGPRSTKTESGSSASASATGARLSPRPGRRASPSSPASPARPSRPGNSWSSRRSTTLSGNGHTVLSGG